MKHPELNTKITKLKLLKIKCKYFLEYKNFKDNLIKRKCLCCSKNYQNFDENLKKKFLYTFKFSNHDIKKFILLLQKVFTLVNIWMIGENSMKRCYLKKKIFTVTLRFENFRNMCYELCELDPAQFFSLHQK